MSLIRAKLRALSIGLKLPYLRRLLGVMREYRASYFAICAIGILLAALEMVPPKLMGWAVDVMNTGSFSMATIGWYMAGWALVALVLQIVHGYQIALACRNGEKVTARLRGKMFAHMQKLSMSFYDRTHVGRLLALFGGDMDTIRGTLVWGFNTITSNAAFMVFSGLMILLTDYKLFLAVIWLFPVVTLLNAIYGKKISLAWAEVRQVSARVGSNQAENINGVKVVTAFNRQARNFEDFNRLQELDAESTIAASKRSGVFYPVMQWIRFSGQAIILMYGGYRVACGNLKTGDLVAASMYWEWLMMPASNYGAFFNELLVAATGAERIFGFLDEAPGVQDRPGASPLPRLKGHVRFEHVSFEYLAGRAVLHQVDFEIPAGSTVALVGATGSGKTTILSLLSRFYEPSAGRVLLDGHDTRLHTLDSLHHQMAMVLQTNFLFSGTIMDNLRYVRPSATDEEIFQAAKDLGCHERILALPQGYLTPVGDKGDSLSLGERQLICFTRALVASPSLLLLDEATSALDPVTDLHVQRALRRLTDGRTTFIVTHRLSTAVSADLVLMLENGRLVEAGPHDQLVGYEGTYSRLFADSVRGSERVGEALAI